MAGISIPFKTSNGTSWVPLESWLMPEGRIFIQGDITQDTACELVQKLMYLKKKKPEEEIKIYINSVGGEISAGLAIYDVVKAMQDETDVICFGMAASMAAIILAAGKKGRRFIFPHSKVMIHEPLIVGGFGGSATTIQHTAESILEAKKVAIELLAADTGRTLKEVEQAMSYDNYMNAEEAVAFGICDGIITDVL